MRVPRIVVFALIGFVVAALLLFFFGRGGVLDYRGLLAYRSAVADNVADLERINSELQSQVQALGSDSERLILQARELGYFREGERVIRTDARARSGTSYTVGRVLHRGAKPARADWPYRTVGLALPLLLVLLSAVLRRGRQP
jgi:cell division protein FtsB